MKNSFVPVLFAFELCRLRAKEFRVCMKYVVTKFSCIFLVAFFVPSIFWGKVLEDFDQSGGLGARWTASQGMLLERVGVAPSVRHEGVAGRMLKVKAVAGGYFASKSDFPDPRFVASSGLKFRINASGVSKQQPLVFEFQSFATERKAWRWTKVSIDSTGWQTVELPTRYFRHSGAAYLPWEETRRFAFRFRNAGRIELDGVELVDAPVETHPSTLSLEELSRLAFGPKGRIHRSGSFAILTDEPRLKPEETFAQLNRMLQMFRSDFPLAKLPAQPIPLLIFSKESRYRTFWGDLSAKFNSQGPVPPSGGYAMLGIAGSFYDPAQGSVRPVYLHEACHALIARTFGLASQGGWLQEGLANYYQLRWGKKDTGVFAQNLLANRRLVPLGKLLDGSPIGMKNYAQVALVIEWILATRKDGLHPAIRGMAKQGSSALAPLAQVHFGKSLAGLEEEWISWLKTR